jgi:predicted permease
MSGLRRLAARMAAFLRHDASEEELEREVAAHVALIEEEHRRRGLAPDEARLAARRAMGSVAFTKDLHRDARSFGWLDDLRRDLRYAVRELGRRPGFTAVAVSALALGIGVNTTFFTLVNAICLRGLPIEAPERVLYVSSRDAQNRSASLSYAEFEELRARAIAFSQVAAYTMTVAAVGDDRQPPARVSGAYLSAGAFELLGDRPVLGRTFRPDEDRPGAPPVVILGSELWSTRYASDPGIVGQSITVNGVPSTVIGVMPRGFMFPSNADLWRPLSFIAPAIRESRAERRLAVFARLAPGTTTAQARAELAAIGGSWAREFPATNRDLQLRAAPINEQLNPTVWQRAWIAFITAGALVLLVACANVASLLLMRSAGRARELAVRASIGATRARIGRQLVAESAVLAAVAGAAGILLSWIGVRALASLVPPETMPYWMAFTIDGRVLAVTMAVCLGCVFVCALPSALHVSRLDLRGVLSESGTTAAAQPSRRWVAALLTTEFAVTLVLVALAVTSVRSIAEGRLREFQIDPASLVTARIALPGDSYGTPPERIAFFDRLEEVATGSGLPGSLALASELPYGGGPQMPIAVVGQPAASPPPTATVVSVSERYFSVLRLRLTHGRAFTAGDDRQGAEAVIVNERFVQMFLADRDPLGASIHVGKTEVPLRIVGVAANVRQQVGGGSLPDPVVFRPLRASAPLTAALIVRSPGDPAVPIAWLRREVASIDPNLPLYRTMTFEQAVRDAHWNGRMSDTIVRSIAVVALLLAMVGLYAVTGHTVERWRREFGLRIALGARSGQVAWLVVRRVLLQLSVGLGIGVLAALAFDRTFNDPAGLNGVSMTDPAALGVIVISIAFVAVVGCLVPILRAARVDPLVVLRAE